MLINETLLQFAPLSDISQGSVATHFMCGGTLVIVLLQMSPDSDSKSISKIG